MCRRGHGVLAVTLAAEARSPGLHHAHRLHHVRAVVEVPALDRACVVMVWGHHSRPRWEALVHIRLRRSSLMVMLVCWVWVQSERGLVHQLEGHGNWLVVGRLVAHRHRLVHGVLREGALVGLGVVRRLARVLGISWREIARIFLINVVGMATH